MIRVLLDTNVILDVLLERQPWVVDAKAIWSAHLSGRLAAHVTATSLTDVFYVSRRIAGRSKAWMAVRACLDQLFVIPVGLRELVDATKQATGDFEDNLQIASAVAAQIDAIVTRDRTGFQAGAVSVLEPSQLIARLTWLASENDEEPPRQAGTGEQESESTSQP